MTGSPGKTNGRMMEVALEEVWEALEEVWEALLVQAEATGTAISTEEKQMTGTSPG